jgi:hypothetical protein
MKAILLSLTIALATVSCISSAQGNRADDSWKGKDLNFSGPIDFDIQDLFHVKVLTVIESEMAVIGPYSSGLYTVNAEDGMKFVIVAYTMTNISPSPRYPLIYSSGKVMTYRGHIYSSWTPLGGLNAKEYRPRHSTPAEIVRYGGKGEMKQLYPDKTVLGSIVFYVPNEEDITEVDLPDAPSVFAVNQ